MVRTMRGMQFAPHPANVKNQNRCERNLDYEITNENDVGCNDGCCVTEWMRCG